jgi:rubrerythrin
VHEKRYKELYESLKCGKVFKKDEVVVWKCQNCGYLHVGKEAPVVCPTCKYPQCYFEIQAQNW